MATELGKAYVQIVPSARGLGKAINDEVVPKSKVAGKSAGLGIAGMIKGTLIAAGIGKALIDTIKEGGKLQQSLGGIETLFKNNADKVKEYAKEAYKTTGLSANAYMENVTGFSASLLQSLGGDTKKAAEIANTAMIDMADNSNKMGTAMESIQNAYQGFAKQNYTMLDNLKLGYGGTKTEMQRLLKDAQKITGVKYDMSNLADVYQAIHVIQSEMDITGTTAKEASETISGSFSAFKGAFQNVLGAFAIGDGLEEALSGLGQTLSTFVFKNLIPMIGNIIMQLPTLIKVFWENGIPELISMGLSLINTIGQGLTDGYPMFLEKVNNIVVLVTDWINTQLPLFIDKGVKFAISIGQGLIDGIPGILKNTSEILIKILSAILGAIPKIIQGGFDLIKGLAKGFMKNLPAVEKTLTEILTKVVNLIFDKGPVILSKGFELIGQLAKGLIKNLPAVVMAIGRILIKIISLIISKMPDLLSKGFELIKKFAKGLSNARQKVLVVIGDLMLALVNKIKSKITSVYAIGKNLIKGLWNGINDVKGWIMRKIEGFSQSILNKVKSFFGIHSPSTVFAEIGEYLNLGLAKGITDNIKPVSKAIDKLSVVAERDFTSQAHLDIKRKMDSFNVNMNKVRNSLLKDTLDNISNEFIVNATVREEADIKKIARELYQMQLAGARG